MVETLTEILNRGGPALWAIALLSVITLATILWKLWRLTRIGAFETRASEAALADASYVRATDLRSRVLAAALNTRDRGKAAAVEETARIARGALAEARAGLRALDLIVTIAPLIGLLGTVLGMIEAFQALESAGQGADPGVLAGGIWQALLTTAAGMGVAIPAAAALSWFDGISDRLALDFEDISARVLAGA